MDAAYVAWQKRHAVKPFLNIGVGANTLEMEGPGIYHLDMDRWTWRNMVQGDVHDLPFRDDAFASCLAGDVLEHFVNPLRALAEMRRVAPLLVCTVFSEWRLGGPGQNIPRGQEILAPTLEQFKPYKEKGQVTEQIPEARQSHVPHINQWETPEPVIELFRHAGFSVERFETDHPGVHDDHLMTNWLFVCRRTL